MPGFTSAEGGSFGPNDVPRDGRGRYLIPRYPLNGPMEPGSEPIPGEGMAQPWTRASTIAGMNKNKEGIFVWEKRLITKGIATRPDLIALAAAAVVDDKQSLDSVWRQAFDFAKGRASSNLGTALHNFTDQIDSGQIRAEHVPEPWRADIMAYSQRLADAEIELIPGLAEQRIVLPDAGLPEIGREKGVQGIGGTFDRIVMWKGRPTVADLKTGGDPLKWGAVEIAIQLGIYANAWAWWDGSHFHAMPADLRTDKALVIHLAAGQGRAEIEEVDLDGFQEDIHHAYYTRKRRKQADRIHRSVFDVEPAADPSTPSEEHPLADADREPAVRINAAETVARVDAMAKAAGRNDDEDAPAAGQAIAAQILNGEGKPLAPLAVAGQRGCSACGRTGHRKGGKACLGEADPGPVATGYVKAPVQDGPPPEPAIVGPVCSHGQWTRNADGGFECGICGAPAAERSAQTFDSEANQVANGDKADRLTAGADDGIGSAEDDPFQDEEAGTEQADKALFLGRLQQAKDKAEIRQIRTEATELGVWDKELLDAGLERLKAL